MAQISRTRVLEHYTVVIRLMSNRLLTNSIFVNLKNLVLTKKLSLFLKLKSDSQAQTN